jgi:hypoxanthine phosphoribosyltransferase
MNAIHSYLRIHRIYNIRKHTLKTAKRINIKFPKTMIVVSPYKGGFRMSRPCADCVKVMKMYGIKEVIYSTGNPDEPFVKEKVCNIHSGRCRRNRV